jgi:Na+/melibiose symporter-like transporter
MGGYLSSYSSIQITLAVAALITAALLALALWQPRVLAEDESAMRPAHESGIRAILRLASHRPLWPAAAIMFLWTFSPGWDTPLLYYLTTKLKFTDAMYGTFEACQDGATALSIVGYGLACRRISLRRLLWIGTALGTLAGPLFLLIRGPQQALVIAIIVGLLCGIAVGAYMDLLFRACPKDLEGTATAVGGAAFFIALYFGDLFGSWLYDKSGFPLAMAATTISSALIFAFLPFLPRDLTAMRDA